MRSALFAVLVLSLLPATSAQAGRVPTYLGIVAGLSILTGAYYDVAQPDADTAFGILSVGRFDGIERIDESTEFRLEYRPGFQIWRGKPLFGVFATDAAGLGIYFGMGHDLNIGEHIVLNVNTAGTFYAAGKSKHLGSYAVLRSGVELSYRFDNAARFSLVLHHMSHGKIFDKKNPGTEVVSISYTIPLGN